MSETTLEEASRCPKCEFPCELTGKKLAPRGRTITRGAELYTYTCKNTRCKWFDQVARVVQVNPDGTIPLPLKRDKDYPKVPDRTAQVNAMLEQQLERELTRQRGGETPEIRR